MYFKTGVFWQSFICSMHITASHRHETNGSINTFGNDVNRRIKNEKWNLNGFCPPSSNSRNSNIGKINVVFLGWIDTCIFVLVCIWNTKNQEKNPSQMQLPFPVPFFRNVTQRPSQSGVSSKESSTKKRKSVSIFVFVFSVCIFLIFVRVQLGGLLTSSEVRLG